MLIADHRAVFKEIKSLREESGIFSPIYFYFLRKSHIKRLGKLKETIKAMSDAISKVDAVPEDVYFYCEKILFDIKEINSVYETIPKFWTPKLSQKYSEIISLAYKLEKDGRIKHFSQDGSPETSDITHSLSDYSKLAASKNL